jgi:hypothetical protein
MLGSLLAHLRSWPFKTSEESNGRRRVWFSDLKILINNPQYAKRDFL